MLKLMKIGCWGVALCVLGTSFLLASSHGTTPSSKTDSPHPPQLENLFFTSKVQGKTPETEFECAGQIYSYFTFPKEFAGTHQVEGVWKRPDGVVQEHTTFDWNMKPKGNRTARLWLQFHEESSLRNIGAEMDSQKPGNEFDGEWSLEILCDKQTVADSSFRVKCQ